MSAIPNLLEQFDVSEARVKALVADALNKADDGELFMEYSEGEVLGFGTLWIGERAHVEARVEADALIVAGCVKGEIVARDRIELLRSLDDRSVTSRVPSTTGQE